MSTPTHTFPDGCDPIPGWPHLRGDGTGVLLGPWDDPEPAPWRECRGLRSYLLDQGYQPGYTSRPGVLGGVDIDAEVARTTPCMSCKRTGARFEAWSNSEGGYGYAVAICQCGFATTF